MRLLRDTRTGCCRRTSPIYWYVEARSRWCRHSRAISRVHRRYQCLSLRIVKKVLLVKTSQRRSTHGWWRVLHLDVRLLLLLQLKLLLLLLLGSGLVCLVLLVHLYMLVGLLRLLLRVLRLLLLLLLDLDRLPLLLLDTLSLHEQLKIGLLVRHSHAGLTVHYWHLYLPSTTGVHWWNKTAVWMR